MKTIYAFFNRYWASLNPIWTAVAILLTVAVWFWLSYKRQEPKRKWISCTLLLYMLLVYSFTVLSRQVESGSRYELQLFWSYGALFQGQKEFFMYIVMNIFMLLPVGFLLSALGKSGKCTLLCGSAFSCLIELSQLITGKGLFELDDIFHNTLGVWLGILLYDGVWRCVSRFRKKCQGGNK